MSTTPTTPVLESIYEKMDAEFERLKKQRDNNGLPVRLKSVWKSEIYNEYRTQGVETVRLVINWAIMRCKGCSKELANNEKKLTYREALIAYYILNEGISLSKIERAYKMAG
jgi:hypothetical protein